MERQSDTLSIQAALPWGESDGPRERFEKLVQKLRSLTNNRESVDLRKVSDNYIWTLWTLALSIPVAYLEGHPFDLRNDGEVIFYKLENRLKGQALPLDVPMDGSPRRALALKSPDGPTGEARFEVFMDGVQILRPILFLDLPRSTAAVKNPLLFVGTHREEFGNKARELTGGPLAFEAYLFWAPKIVPKQHQGVILRVGNASGALFDADFMGYETSELTRKSQVTAEIFVMEGLDDAINIDRESFNYAHPHYQFLTKWLHSAFRQFSNRHKELGKQLRTARLQDEVVHAEQSVANKVREALRSRGIEDVPEVMLLARAQNPDAAKFRREGKIVLHQDVVIPPSTQVRRTEGEANRVRLAEKKAVAITQLLHGMGLLDSLSYADQEKLIRDIMDIVMLEDQA
jgi:hypothetical protein